MGFKVRFSVEARTGRSAATLAGLLLLSACGGGGEAPTGFIPPDENDAGSQEPEDAGSGADADARVDGSADDGGMSNPNGPLVEVISPSATDDPDSEDVVTTGTVSVQCEAKKNPKGERVDPASVKVSIYAGTEAKPVVTQKAISNGDDTFEAQNIDLSAVAHGSIRIECEASDLATTAERSTQSITTLLDKGPEITFLNPTNNGFVPAGVGMGEDTRVRFRVAPQPLGDDDTGAEVTEIKATVGGKPIAKLDPSTTEENVYSFGLDFNDTQLFSVVPATLSVRVDASNKRAPKPRAVSGSLSVGVDSEGPVITVRSPERSGGLDPVVSGKVDVVLEVKDALAGVDPTSVEIRIEKKADGGQATGKDVYEAELQGNYYVASFETGTYPGLASLSITLYAKDKAGIETQSNLPVDVDSVPPWISLDPPKVREAFYTPSGYECGGPFDPLGERGGDSIEMVNDLMVVNTAFRPRVLMWDRSLTIPNVVTRVAMIKATTPRLYIQHNVDQPLLVDSDNDPNNECDAVNVNSQNPSLAPVTLTLTPLTTAGAAPPPGEWVPTSPNTSQLQVDFSPAPSGVGVCARPAPASAAFPPPQGLAPDTNLTRIIKHTAQGGGTVVYVDSPAPAGLRNTGKDYVSPRLGWACLVATATDNAGNESLSEPLRTCFAGDSGQPCPEPAPTCTDGCVIPAQFRKDAPNAMPQLLMYR